MNNLRKSFQLFHYDYLLHIFRHLISFDSTASYLYQKKSLRCESNIILLKRLKKKFSAFFTTDTVTFLHDFSTFKDFFFFSLKKKNLDKTKSFWFRTFSRKKKPFVLGYPLLKNKGGFKVEFNGFFGCFLPFSHCLYSKRRVSFSSVFFKEFRKVHIFNMLSFSHVMRKDDGFNRPSFNIVLSRKLSVPRFLKKCAALLL